MDDLEYVERRMAADSLRREAEHDDERARQIEEDNPMYSGYLRRRADHKRDMANIRDGGIGQ